MKLKNLGQRIIFKLKSVKYSAGVVKKKMKWASVIVTR